MRWRSWVFPLVVLALLEGWARTAGQHSDTLAAPSAAVGAMVEMVRDGTLWEATAFTLSSALLGLLLGGGIGLALGLCLGLSRLARRLGYVSIELLRPLPAIALLPLAMLLFGFGLSMQVSVVAFASVWPLLVITQAAVQQVDAQWMEMAATLGMSRCRRLCSIVLPAVLARLFVGLRLGAAIALVVAVTVEIAANPHGVGYGMWLAQQSLQPERMLAWLAWVALLGYGVNAAALALQRCAQRRMGDSPS